MQQQSPYIPTDASAHQGPERGHMASRWRGKEGRAQGILEEESAMEVQPEDQQAASGIRVQEKTNHIPPADADDR